MSWFMAGAATLTAASSLYSMNSSANASAKAMGRQSMAEAKAIEAERLNGNIRNSYATAFSQMQLALKKRQLTQQSAGVTEAALQAQADVDTLNAATGTVGASAQAVSADIEMRAAEAQYAIQDSMESAVEQHSLDLQMMVLNTEQSKPQVREYRYDGPSMGEMFATAAIQGAAQFVSGYGMRQLQLGLGPGQPQTLASPQFGSDLQGVRNPFSTRLY